MTSQPKIAKLFIGLMAAGGLISLGSGLAQMHTAHRAEFGALLVLAVLASRLKLKLPGLQGNMSVSLPFILIAFVELNLFEALLVALFSTAAQCFPKGGGKPKPIHMLFNVSTMTVAVGLGELICHGFLPGTVRWSSLSLLVAVAGLGFFLAQTIPVAAIISLTEGGRLLRIWSGIAHLSFPYFVLSAGVTSIVTTASHRAGWQVPLLLLPVMYGVYRSYQVYFVKAVPLAGGLAMATAAASNN
jgi:hypothetical protein